MRDKLFLLELFQIYTDHKLKQPLLLQNIRVCNFAGCQLNAMTSLSILLLFACAQIAYSDSDTAKKW